MRHRTSIDYADWPDVDRRLFDNALRKSELFEADGLAARWAPETVKQVKKGYGKFLCYLLRQGVLDDNALPSQRICEEVLEGYIDWLDSQRLSPVTIASRATDLQEAVRVMEPTANIELLRELVPTLRARETPQRIKHPKLVHPQYALECSVTYLDDIDEHPLPNEKVRACRYRDALMIAFLCTRPIRLKNLTQLRIGSSILRDEPGFSCHFAADETKERAAFSFQLPGLLTHYLDSYIDRFRPTLLDGRVSDRLWITIRRTPMAAQTIYCHVCDMTRELLGHSINPHLFRDMVATTIATDRPDHVMASARLLHNSSIKTTTQHYIQSQMIDAQRVLIDVVDQRRRQAP